MTTEYIIQWWRQRQAEAEAKAREAYRKVGVMGADGHLDDALIYQQTADRLSALQQACQRIAQLPRRQVIQESVDLTEDLWDCIEAARTAGGL